MRWLTLVNMIGMPSRRDRFVKTPLKRRTMTARKQNYRGDHHREYDLGDGQSAKRAKRSSMFKTHIHPFLDKIKTCAHFDYTPFPANSKQ